MNRKLKDKIFQFFIYLSVSIVSFVLLFITGYVLYKGFSSINLDFFIRLPKPVGEKGGGMVNAIVGSFMIVGIASLFSIPLSILTGVYLSEYKNEKFANIVRSSLEILGAVPSIIIGIFVYGLVVYPMKRFSLLAGSIALSIIMIPLIARTTEEMLNMVPTTIKEAGLSLGIKNWKVIFYIILNTAKPGVLTGVLLSLARVFGETAPLLFTSFGNRFWHRSLLDPAAALPLQIFVYAIAPYDDWNRQAWAGAFVLIVIVYILIIVSRRLVLKYK
jgi:phosphate transport system permease protein